MSLWHVKRVGEAASDEYVAGAKYPQHIKKVTEEKSCLLQQVFNLDETGVFYKKIPVCTFMSKTENNSPGFKISKVYLTHLLCNDACGDCIVNTSDLL
jgi:hypothetical protein